MRRRKNRIEYILQVRDPETEKWVDMPVSYAETKDAVRMFEAMLGPTQGRDDIRVVERKCQYVVTQETEVCCTTPSHKDQTEIAPLESFSTETTSPIKLVT